MAKRITRFALIVLLAAPAFALAGQQSTKTPPASTASRQAFIRAADQVLRQVSQLIDLPILHPLKKSLRSKAQIRAYLVQEEKNDKHPAKRHADKLALEAFGLIPQGFHLNHFMLNLLTQQIAGYYDPKKQEFYIAEWIPISEQRVVMAHELTHALQDQHFHIEQWVKAARPNDDAVAARQAVLEGSAVVAMIDYELRGLGRTVREMPDMGPLTQLVVGDATSSPGFAKAPRYIRDSLLFPYLTGAVFTQRLLKAGNGWPDFYKVFQRPPVSTQQVMQPSFYLNRKAPSPVKLPELEPLLGRRWKLLDQDVFGEFGLQEILRQFLPASEAQRFAPDWWGDRYAILQSRQTDASLLLYRLRLDSAEHARQFFAVYSKLLRKKHATASQVFNAREFLAFHTVHGGVFFDCHGDECFSMEGGRRQSFDRVIRAMGWPRPPRSRGPSNSGGLAGPVGAPFRAPSSATVLPQ